MILFASNPFVNPRRKIVSILGTALFVLSGCKPDAAVKKAEVIDKAAQPVSASQPAPPPADAGEVQGVIHFDGKPPARISIDMSMDPACTFAAANMTEQYITAGGKLANVFVYIKSGAPTTQAPAGAPAVVLDQKGCRYTPHVIAVQQGGTVEFHNSDPTMHNVHITPASDSNNSVDVSQGPMGQPEKRTFTTPELMVPVRCNNHPWMNAFINVAPNQFFAVSGADGTFDIKGLPPGHYTLAAVHEKLGEQDTEITVAPHGIVKTNLSFTAK